MPCTGGTPGAGFPQNRRSRWWSSAEGSGPQQGEVETALEGDLRAAAAALPEPEAVLAAAAGTDPLELLHTALLQVNMEGSPGVEPGLPGPRPGVRNRHTPIP